MKTCTKCQETKTYSEFSKQSYGPDGYRSRCKECRNNESCVWYSNNTDKRLAKSKELYVKKKKIILKKIKEYRKTDAGKMVIKKAHKKYNDKFPQKYQARSEVFKAVSRGYLVKEACLVCGDNKSEAHHEDYSKPLDVVWLCNKHHRERHSNA